MKNITHENKVFYTFLIVHLLVWTAVSLIRVVMPTDTLEGIYWGSLHDFGTPKHPPLAGWITYLTYLPFKSDLMVYFVSQLFILLGFVYIYKLARYFLDEQKSILSVILLEGCWCYSYITCYYGFNPDVVLLFTLPAITYYVGKCVKYNKNSDWIILGIITGLSLLNKYQTVLIIAPLLIWACIFRREIFRNKFLYISMLIAFLMFLPHILWLIKYDFFPFMYFENELTERSLSAHIEDLINFLLLQVAALAGTVLIYTSLKIKNKSKFKLVEKYNKDELWFILFAGLTPFLFHLFMGIFSNGTMHGRWNFEFLFMTGIMLFYLFPTKLTKRDFMFCVKFAYIIMLIVLISMGTLLSVEKNYRSRYPVSTIYNHFENIFEKKFHSNIKYVGGYIEWSLPLTIYGNSHPECLLDTFGYKSPWIDYEDLKKSGALFISRTKENVIDYVKSSCPYLPEDYIIEPLPYSFKLTNAFNMQREYEIYYFIVPPM
ncbi:glycosyltransferase family 39 protein [bacterium]|nr:glycosyltransferase family 39 protein [bacterium]